MRRAALSLLASGAVLIAPAIVIAQPARSIAIKDVKISRDGDVTVVTIEADGALPAPAVGELDGPPRFFLDFHGVNAATRGATAEPGGNVIRVRVARHADTPPTTRVVVDMAEKQPVRTEAGDRDAGRFKVLIGIVTPEAEKMPSPAVQPGAPPPVPMASAPPPIQPVEQLPPPPTARPESAPTSGASVPAAQPPPQVYPSRPPATPLPQKDVEKYREQIDPALARLQKLRSVLQAIDSKDPKPPEGLPAAREELSGVLRALTGARPPESVRATHDLLLKAVSFGLMAATLRDDAGTRGDPERLRNAGSAAAGALLLLDRVCQDIGC
jgi:hypothetical protein